jgi:hypothetical protein
MTSDKKPDAILDEVDPQKRDFIGKLIGTTAFAAPIIASFAMTGLTIADAHAASGPNVT